MQTLAHHVCYSAERISPALLFDDAMLQTALEALLEKGSAATT
jgi:hypothetical protein